MKAKEYLILIFLFFAIFIFSQSEEKKEERNFPFVFGTDFTFSKSKASIFFAGCTFGKSQSSGGAGAYFSATSGGLSLCFPYNTKPYPGIFFQQDIIVIPTPILLTFRSDLFYSAANKNLVFRPAIGISFLFVDFTYSFANSWADQGMANIFPEGKGFTIRIKYFTGINKWQKD